METAELELLGFTRNQSVVYIALLKRGSCSAQSIIKDTGMHRSRVYDSLEKLQELGLASSVVKDFKRYFQAASPKKLFEQLDEKKKMLHKIMPELERIEGMKREEINASIYKGTEGMKTVFSEMLHEGEDVYVLGAKGLIFSVMQYYTPTFERERINKNMKFITLYDNENVQHNEEIKLKRKKIQGKSLPKGSESKAVAHIFGSKVAITRWEEKYPTTFVIDNRDIANAFRLWFKIIYERVE